MTAGTAPAIELSGTWAFRGGGGTESREWGRYAVAVCNFRFDDNCSRLPELKFRSVKGQVRRVGTLVLAANLKQLAEDDVRATAHRCIDMMSVSTKSMRVSMRVLSRVGRKAIHEY